MNRKERMRSAVVLVLFAVIFSVATISSYTTKSASWDEPQHLASGYLALTQGDYRLDPEHPPLMRIWAALPLLAKENITGIPDRIIDTINPIHWVEFLQFSISHQFLYKKNDADALLYPARFMIVLLGIGLGVILYFWAHEWLGFWPATVVLTFYSLEPNILAHSTMVTTDLGITYLICGSTYFTWRTARSITPVNLIGTAVFVSLAAVSKYSAIVLAPIVCSLLVIRALRKTPWPIVWGRNTKGVITRLMRLAVAVGICVCLGCAAYGSIWAVYGFRYNPSDSTDWVYKFEDESWVTKKVPEIARITGWIDENRLLPNSFIQGFLLGQAKAQERSAFLAGEFDDKGWWYFFPVAFAIKTPISLLILFLAGIFYAVARWRTFFENEIFLLLPLGIYLGIAMTTKLNIGLRHILPIYPFVILFAGIAAAGLLSTATKRSQLLLGILLLFCSAEFISIYPHYLAFFNRIVGGPSNGSYFLVDSNLDWGQDLKGLKKWMDENYVDHINLSYFGTADPAYYEINCTYIPQSPFFAVQSVQAPRLPGYVAISWTNLRTVYSTKHWGTFFSGLWDVQPVTVIGHSICVYWIDKPW